MEKWLSGINGYIRNNITKIIVVTLLCVTGFVAGMITVTRGFIAIHNENALSCVGEMVNNDVKEHNSFALENNLYAERTYSNNSKIMQGSFSRNWRVFTTASSLGLVYETMNIDQVFRALPGNSMAVIPIVYTCKGFYNYPNNNGLLYVRKSKPSAKTPATTYCEFVSHNGKRKWRGTFFGDENTDYTWTNWEEVTLKNIDRPRNPQRCVDEMIEVAKSYYDKGIVYGLKSAGLDDGTANGFNSLATDIDCSGFVRLVLEGIPYYRSKFYNSSNPWRYLNCYSWAMHPPKGWGAFINWCWRNGWEIDPGINYGNLQKGDLVFWGGWNDRWGKNMKGVSQETIEHNYANGQYTNVTPWLFRMYRSITHVAIFTGEWVTDVNGNKHPVVIQSTGYKGALPLSPTVGIVTGGIRYDYLDSKNIPPHSSQYEVMFIRMPLCETKAYNTVEYDKNVLNRNMIMSYYHKADLTIKGNGQDVIIDVNTRNLIVSDNVARGDLNSQTGEEEPSLTNRISTWFMPVTDVTFTEHIQPNTFVSHNNYYYDKEKKFIGNSPTNSSKYLRIVLKKTDDSRISESDLYNFKNKTCYVNHGTVKKYERGYGTSIIIPAAKIPNGATCKRRNGLYSITTDGVSWEPLDTTTRTLLESVYLYDGENHIRVINGQEVEIL